MIILLESGSKTLLESGSNLLGEAITVIGDCELLLQDGYNLLLQNGDDLLLQCGESPPVPPTAQHGGGYTVGKETRAMWESEGERLRIIRDDEEVLVLL